MNTQWAELAEEETEGDIHVLPIDDLLPHEDTGTDCRCDPRVEVYGARLLVIHNAFDGRE